MTNNPAGLTGPGRLATPTAHLNNTPPESAPATRTFAMRFTSTPRGARLARHLTAVRLDAWGVPYGTGDHDAIVLIVAELTANAVLHGNVPGRDFHFRLALLHTEPRPTVRVEVTDTRAERVPPRPGAALPEAPPVTETGRGLLLITALAARWDWHPRPDGPGKTVWAEYALDGGIPLPAPVQSRQTGV
ncbi:ATP-binding protein [Streptomyces hirsutus]|uniref:ATP-binding protein n=1 Tax=Streptomyces hirsutus TaxID=35620 RepID=UPI003632D71F